MSERNSEFGAEETQDDPIVGAAPADDDTPGEYHASDQSGGLSEETGVTYEATGEPESTPNDGPVETDVQDSNPNASGPHRLEGDLGISSERTGPAGQKDSADEGIQGTGSHGTAPGSTDGVMDTSRGGGDGDFVGHQPAGADGPEMDDTQQQATQEWRDDQPAASTDTEAEAGKASIDRTVGESNTAEVPSHKSDPTKNPGHSHG